MNMFFLQSVLCAVSVADVDYVRFQTKAVNFLFETAVTLQFCTSFKCVVSLNSSSHQGQYILYQKPRILSESEIQQLLILKPEFAEY